MTASKSQIVMLSKLPIVIELVCLNEGQYQGAIADVDFLVEIEIIVVVNAHIFICINMVINYYYYYIYLTLHFTLY